MALKKVTPKIHAQTRWHSAPISHFWTQNFSRRLSADGEANVVRNDALDFDHVAVVIVLVVIVIAIVVVNVIVGVVRVANVVTTRPKTAGGGGPPEGSGGGTTG